MLLAVLCLADECSTSANKLHPSADVVLSKHISAAFSSAAAVDDCNSVTVMRTGNLTGNSQGKLTINDLAQGETVPYVICVEKDAEGNLTANQKGLAERAHHPEEINAASNLAIDAEYYLTQQVCSQPSLAKGCTPMLQIFTE